MNEIYSTMTFGPNNVTNLKNNAEHYITFNNFVSFKNYNQSDLLEWTTADIIKKS